MKVAFRIAFLISLIGITSYLANDVTIQERNEYTYWINVRNNIIFDSNQLAKTARLYKPEESTYNTSLLKTSWFMFLLSAITIAMLIIYLIGRFVFKKFMMENNKRSRNHLKFTYFLIIFGLLTTVSLLSTGIYYTVKVNDGVVESHDKAMNQVYEELQSLNRIDALLTSIKNNSYYDMSSLLGEIKDLSGIKLNISSLTDKRINSFSNMKNSSLLYYFFNIFSLVFLVIISTICLLGHIFKKNSLILYPSIVMFLFIPISFVIQGLNLSNFMERIDFCSEVNKFNTENLIPDENYGIGYYSSCISKDDSINLSTYSYLIYESLDTVYKSLLLNGLELPLDNRNNREFEKLLANKLNLDNNTKTALKIIIDYNALLDIFDMQLKCTYLTNTIKQFEKSSCVNNLTNSYFMLVMVIFSIFCYFPLTFGLNRLLIGMYDSEDKVLLKKVISAQPTIRQLKEIE